MKKLIVFGGTFNPLTLAHYQVLKSSVDQLGKDTCGIFVPTSDKYIKRNVLYSKHRCEMILRTLADYPDSRLSLSTIEVDYPKQLRTVATLKLLQEQYPQTELYFLMGADKLQQFSKWFHPEEILQNYHLAVLNREIKGEKSQLEEMIDHDELLNKYREKIVIIKDTDEQYYSISSTKVRENFYTNEKMIQNWISPSVKEYIRENNLYIDEKRELTD